MTATLTTPAHARTCPSCQHTALVKNISAGLDPDRLADLVRAELTRWIPDEDDPDLLYFGPDRELAVDVSAAEVWEGDWHRTREQQLRLALVHLAAALATGARV
ncbi:Uncharacterised protein [Mycobacteroides abscessus subsp. abscessus]|uniref:hypothetical protein n=1 Tax=Mycobacteroides abscessus TaxID=36809 RepID=UPI000929C46A|nr:hypothetical protein [Mycobacteroides abscessus]SHP29056.1 Uncharacterised protein [Mycobacteroides abscessus subsp. abscessus]SHP69335.1 Uncharacterised protein [Mycobacteroides abscessus subsp. abscessus]SHY39521.1 Uncharacterised protein [Mycobacteroides abscessus subsp. abscessus]SKD93192.1 Uncharacterised protein [Mycobacteroides abscessus subsp. abscessus]